MQHIMVWFTVHQKSVGYHSPHSFSPQILPSASSTPPLQCKALSPSLYPHAGMSSIPFLFWGIFRRNVQHFYHFLYIFLVFCPASCHQVPGLRSFESALIIFCFRSSLSPISCSCKAQSAMAFLSAEGRISICWAGFLGFFFGIMLKALLMELQGMSGACSLRSVAGCLCSVVGCGC